MALSYLILGSNSADKESILPQAIALLVSKLGKVKKQSSIYESEAWGYQSTNSYHNQAIIIETEASPKEALNITQEIERDLGRTSKTINGKYEDRPIDIDILFYDNFSIKSKELTIPHPRIQERRFVLEPLYEIAPLFTHPICQKNVKQLLQNCPDQLMVKQL